MKAFRFPLERVLSWRQTQLTVAEADLERSRADLRNIEAEIADLTRRHNSVVDSMKAAQKLSGSDLADVARFRDWAVREGKALRLRTEECRLRIETRSEVVTEARRKSRLVERLKQRRRETWDAEFNRDLEQLAGESALSRWGRDRDRQEI